MTLLRIQSAPTAANAMILLNPADNIAVARVPLAAGQEITIGGETLRVRASVPAGHKVAIRPIGAHQAVIRYGNFIGLAARSIEPGEHVHTHNLAFEEREGAGEVPGKWKAPVWSGPIPVFNGYLRPDGRAGTRNYIAVAAASNCAAHTVQQIASAFDGVPLPPEVDGVVAFPHSEGCGHSIGPDTDQLRRVLSGVLDHPNVAGALLVGLGCEVNQIDAYFPDAARRTDNLIGLTLQSSGGTQGAVAAGVAEVRRLIDAAQAQKRVEISASKIVLGLNCGGSDSFSGISANPALGVCSDLLASFGGTAVLAETTEIFGAERLLTSRARTPEVAAKLMRFVADYKAYLRQFGGSFDDNPSPGNKEGGLTNILEKSLGAVAKGGTSPLMDVVGYAERISSPGLVFMNTPGYDPVSLTGLAAGGVNVIAFTTGRGSAIGFPSVPVIKIATNSGVFHNMPGNMDLNAGRIIDAEATVEQVGREILDLVLRVASGELTSAERLGHREFVPWRIGPVL
jgi:altronate hydrolase